MGKYDDDDIDDLPARKKELSGMDSMYANTNIVILIFFALCCNGLCLAPLILSIIGTFTCTDEKAKANAKLSLIISGIMVFLAVVINIVRFAIGGAAAFGGLK